jgi:hypothetical protein
MLHYTHDDPGYLGWLSEHPDGFVINTYTKPSPAYLRLHHASCLTISRLQPRAKTFTGGDYSKLCGGRVNWKTTLVALVDQRRPARYVSDQASPLSRGAD